MSRTTKSTLALARTAMKVGGRALASYSHPNSPKKFTQPQLFAILAIKQFLKTDYRGMIVMLSEWRELRRALKLRCVPHYSTLCYAEARLLKKRTLTNCLRPWLSSHERSA